MRTCCPAPPGRPEPQNSFKMQGRTAAFPDVSDASARLKDEVARIVNAMEFSQSRVKPAEVENFRDLYNRMVCLSEFLKSFPKEMEAAFRNPQEEYANAVAYDVLRLVGQLSPAIQVSSTSMADKHFLKSMRKQLKIACGLSLAAWHHELTAGGFRVDDHVAWTLYTKLLKATACIGEDREWVPRLRHVLAKQIRKARSRRKAFHQRANCATLASEANPLPVSEPVVLYDLNDSDPDDSV